MWLRYRSTKSTPSLATEALHAASAVSYVLTGLFQSGFPGNSLVVMYLRDEVLGSC